MRRRWLALVGVLAAHGCGGSEPSAPDPDGGPGVDASGDGGDAGCRDGETYSYPVTVDGDCPCLAIYRCSHGSWIADPFDCGTRCAACPMETPKAGTDCMTQRTCKYPCGERGTREVRCIVGGWQVRDCVEVLDRTTGKPCTSAADCDVSGGKATRCGLDSALGPIMSSPVCVGHGCKPWSGPTAQPCDGDTGICAFTTSDPGTCLPRCTFDPLTADPAKGCVGASACTFQGTTTSPTGVTTAMGACLFGCAMDAECPTGSVCQVEDAACVTARRAYVMKPGEPCKTLDRFREGGCSCYAARATAAGFCANVCRVGAPGACPTGTVCDPQLPEKPFTKAAAGLLGRCLPTCVATADCPAGATCEQGGGGIPKTCRVESPILF